MMFKNNDEKWGGVALYGSPRAKKYAEDRVASRSDWLKRRNIFI